MAVVEVREGEDSQAASLLSRGSSSALGAASSLATPEQLDALTSARFFAALFVAIHHFRRELGQPGYVWLFERGWLGVDFFFILSGFIISFVYAEKFVKGSASYLQFLLYRFARLYPLHIFTLLLWCVFALWKHGRIFSGGQFTAEGFVANLLLIQSWGVLDRNTWNAPAWSISAEWFAYLCFPLFLWGATRLKDSLRSYVLAVFFLLLCLQGMTLVLPRRSFNWSYDYALIRISIEFSAGICVYFIYRRLKRTATSKYDWFAAMNGIALVLLLPGVRNRWYDLVPFTALVLTATLILFVALSGGWFSRLASARPLVYCGEISYSIYMVHTLVVATYQSVFHVDYSPAGAALALGLYVAVVCGLAAILYHAVEVPSRRGIRRVGTRFLATNRLSHSRIT
jgi:peptidoglycan/LPS O-acetylase OafA/YrhL